jgi:hypothetical protein
MAESVETMRQILHEAKRGAEADEMEAEK